jgi:hypothetical protein
MVRLLGAMTRSISSVGSAKFKISPLSPMPLLRRLGPGVHHARQHHDVAKAFDVAVGFDDLAGSTATRAASAETASSGRWPPSIPSAMSAMPMKADAAADDGVGKQSRGVGEPRLALYALSLWWAEREGSIEVRSNVNV